MLILYIYIYTRIHLGPVAESSMYTISQTIYIFVEITLLWLWWLRALIVMESKVKEACNLVETYIYLFDIHV